MATVALINYELRPALTMQCNVKLSSVEKKFNFNRIEL